MAHLRNLHKNTDSPSQNSNYGVDYVVHYKLPSVAEHRAEAEAAYAQLIDALSKVGFATEVRHGGSDSLLIFTRIASDKLLNSQIYHSRVQDWLYGVRTSAPGKDLRQYFQDEPVTEAERLRLAYLLMTKPKNEGGAGISPQTTQWNYVTSIFPLHNHAFNKEWIKQWSSKYFLTESDIDQIRDKFGEKVAFYFAFLQSYFTFLLFPAVFGLGAWLVLGQFSWFYALVNTLWSVVFFEHWKLKEVDLAVQWSVRGVSRIQLPRTQFRFDREAQDPVTGEIVKVYSPVKRLTRQLLQLPFALACAIVLGGLIVSCFAIEIFISEVYNGPFKQYLTYLPTIILTTMMPTLSTMLTKLAEKLTELENYETKDAHVAAFVQKIFVLNFITSYLPLFLTAFVYVPFANVLVPYLDIFQVTAEKFTAEGKPLPIKTFKINPDRLTKQVIYFTVTAQVVNFALEVVVPYVKRQLFRAVKEVRTELTSKSGTHHIKDDPDEADFLSRVRNEAELDEYDVTTDYREMVVQFGYLSLFSVVWPLTACSFLVNNWIEARSDALKIALGSRRPIPWRADSIGPWLTSLGFLSWLGSITSSALVFLFSKDKYGPAGTPSSISAWALLLTILLSEHVYFIVRSVVQYVLSKTESTGLQKERAERFATRKQILQEMLDHDLSLESSGGLAPSAGESITREALEEEARQASVKGRGSREEMFWQHQRGAQETIQIGRGMISEATTNSTKGVKH